MMDLDPRQRAPQCLQDQFKRYRKKSADAIVLDPAVIDLQRDAKFNAVSEGFSTPSPVVSEVFNDFLQGPRLRSSTSSTRSGHAPDAEIVRAFEVNDVPGLLLIPGILPSKVQRKLIDVLLHRDLSNPAHLTNVHLHHSIRYPSNSSSFFTSDPSVEASITPKDPSIHKPLSVSQLLDKKLRWMTLGGQYDWTNKEYPGTVPPGFPHDIKNLLMALFPVTTPEAAILNIYSPGDTLSMHRDVSEESDRPLISISIGCDGLFVIGFEPEPGESTGKHAIVRLRSGDAVYMTGRSRYAWHGVPSIIPNTCPEDLQDWPCLRNDGSADESVDKYEHWRGWLAGKRINLNVRQMKVSGVETM